MLELSDYDYELPKELIAQEPTKARDSSRLLVVNRETNDISLKNFKDVINYLDKGDVLVINETKVIPARFFAIRKDTGAKIEIFLLKEISENTWEVMVKPGRKAKLNIELELPGDATCTLKSITETGTRIAEFKSEDDFLDYIHENGNMPLPPYIDREVNSNDKDRYQTVFASKPGAVAAPTAGLHFTDELLKEIENKGIKIAKIVLHVGIGTFKPIKVTNIKDHKMHEEYYEVSTEAAEIINKAKSVNNKIIALGTTSVRAIESVADEKGIIQAHSGETDIFIYPGYKFRVVDKLITNFHLPKSSLMLLVSAFSSINMIKKAYQKAIDEEYRFFSYGDAMIII
ncbi:MAG: tRNA preQ1(34) S-adenosylmethionine ribosyltransferase-isomerase QueA [Candidatus Delongbacteria bacterium]|jgi:S-adenosylmethionine:tRNA ribosyltransferase-isomerase|nr:tRNA preQ1(34) S-adenosylmethionine ribosyltransferase-isomerase QueA [Candidatus Delongbacteria bacterium]